MKGTCVVFPVVMAGCILCSPVLKKFCKVRIRNNSLGNCQFKFLKFSLKDFYDFRLTSCHTCICCWYYSAHVIYMYSRLWDTAVSGHPWTSNWMVFDGKHNKSNKW